MTIHDLILELKRINNSLGRKLQVAEVTGDSDTAAQLSLAKTSIRNSVESLEDITEIIDTSLNYDREIL